MVYGKNSLTFALAAALPITQGAEFRFKNQCSYTINLYGAGSQHICDIPSGASRDNNCDYQLLDHGIFRHTGSDEANCKYKMAVNLLPQQLTICNVVLEYSVNNNGYGLHEVWYDVSNIPPSVSLIDSAYRLIKYLYCYFVAWILYKLPKLQGEDKKDGLQCCNSS